MADGTAFVKWATDHDSPGWWFGEFGKTFWMGYGFWHWRESGMHMQGTAYLMWAISVYYLLGLILTIWASPTAPPAKEPACPTPSPTA